MTRMKEQEKIQQEFKNKMDYEELLNCMRCGFCLPTCPTYIESGFQESHSPRGRIALMKGVVDGLIEPDEDVERSLNLCLGCRACETVCPPGVKYGHLLEQARDIIQQNKKHSYPVKLVRKVVFQELFPYPNRMRVATNLISFYQRTGLQKFARKSGFLKLLPEHLTQMEKVLPEIPHLKGNIRPNYLPPEGEQKKKVAFFSGCLMDTMFIKTNDATMKLLQLAGCEILIPPSQTCCGALHGHAGEKDQAKELAKQNIAAFEGLGIDYIITNAGGCGAFLFEYDHLLKDEPEWAERAKKLAEKIKDISTVLIELNFHKRNLSLPNYVVTYQDSCHLKNVMGVSYEPRQLIRSIEGITYQEMQDAGRCCGSGGIFNIVQPEMSMQVLDYKMTKAKETAANVIVTANPGCLLQMKLGIEREGLSNKIRAVHLVDLLLEAIGNNINN